MESNKINSALQALCNELPGAIGCTLIEISSGLSLGSYSLRPTISFDVTAAYNAEVIKQKQKALKALHFENEKMEEIIFTLDTQLHLIKLLSNTVALYLAVDKSQGNLGLIKITLDKYANSLKSLL